jgi:hypothetical protein
MARYSDEYNSKLELAELRRLYDRINIDYNTLRTRILTLLGGEVIAISFIFGGDNFLPAQTYGKVFYFSGIGLLMLATAFLFLGSSPVTWLAPFELDEAKKMPEGYETPEKLHKFIKDEYIESIEHCMEKQAEKARYFTWALRTLFAGVIILLILKFTQ